MLSFSVYKLLSWALRSEHTPQCTPKCIASQGAVLSSVVSAAATAGGGHEFLQCSGQTGMETEEGTRGERGVGHLQSGPPTESVLPAECHTSRVGAELMF